MEAIFAERSDESGELGFFSDKRAVELRPHVAGLVDSTAVGSHALHLQLEQHPILILFALPDLVPYHLTPTKDDPIVRI